MHTDYHIVEAMLDDPSYDMNLRPGALTGRLLLLLRTENRLELKTLSHSQTKLNCVHELKVIDHFSYL